jgi:hypothetical protein
MGLLLRCREPVMRLAARAGTACTTAAAIERQKDVIDEAQAGYAATRGPTTGAGELAWLSQLHASGALTDEELAVATARAPGS